MTTLDDVAALAAREHGLVVVATTRGDGTVQASVVNAGVMPHPVTGERVVAFVTYGPAKLGNLRARPAAAVTFRVGWEWATVEGGAEIVGPDDPYPGFDPSALPSLLRDVFLAAGGGHDDWDEYDRVMVADRRAAVLVSPTRVYSNR